MANWFSYYNIRELTDHLHSRNSMLVRIFHRKSFQHLVEHRPSSPSFTKMFCCRNLLRALLNSAHKPVSGPLEFSENIDSLIMLMNN